MREKIILFPGSPGGESAGHTILGGRDKGIIGKLKEQKFALRQRVRVLSGDFKGQEGTIYQSYRPYPRYMVEIFHEGYPDNHYHHPIIDEKDLEAVE